ncbi:hypothetical protein LSAT2_001442 [Lamellibrachia satsuma]|nr:hypothetical protein LSAT2_001442 [Lamellibrachia satsuma]
MWKDHIDCYLVTYREEKEGCKVHDNTHDEIRVACLECQLINTFRRRERAVGFGAHDLRYDRRFRERHTYLRIDAINAVPLSPALTECTHHPVSLSRIITLSQRLD